MTLMNAVVPETLALIVLGVGGVIGCPPLNSCSFTCPSYSSAIASRMAAQSREIVCETDLDARIPAQRFDTFTSASPQESFGFVDAENLLPERTPTQKESNGAGGAAS